MFNRNDVLKKSICPRLRFLCLSFFGLNLIVFASFVSAEPIAINNPSFEDNPAAVPTDITVGIPSGWTAYNPNNIAGVFYGSLYAAPDNYPNGAPHGDHVQVNYIAANGAAGAEFGVFQLLSASLEQNTRYTLSVEVGNIDSGFNDLNATPNNPDDDSFFNIAGFNGYRVELQAVPPGQPPQTLVAQTQSVADPEPIQDGQFRPISISYDSRTAPAELIGMPLQILLVNLNEIDPAFPNQDRETNFDDIRLEAVDVATNMVAVPVPGLYLVILGIGLVLYAMAKLARADLLENRK